MSNDIDMHLAYGDIHPDNLVIHRSPKSGSKEAELKGLMTKLDKLMLEAHCIQHSAATIIATLQANPEAMAAVALTLAEISNLLSENGPWGACGPKRRFSRYLRAASEPTILDCRRRRCRRHGCYVWRV